jgi:iron complex transport system substrate-binding protein
VIKNRVWIVLAFASLYCIAVQAKSPPQRIASLNMCIDQLLVNLVPKSRIASVTYLSAHPQLSTISDQLDGLHINHGLAEEIVPLQPDLILAGEFGAGDAITLLQQLGYTVERVVLPRTLDEISTHIQSLGELIGAQQTAATMVSAISQQLAGLDDHKLEFAQQPTAIWYSSDGVVIGDGTLEHELLMRAGYRNLAAEHKHAGFIKMDLEQLLFYAPQMIIVEAGYAESFSLASEYLQHPALRQRSRLLELPAALSVCSAPVVAEALRVLRSGMMKDGDASR